jgi:hypothetical protein
MNPFHTDGAASKLVSPGWSATIVQIPVLSSFTVAPLTVQTNFVSELKLTPRPLEAVALTVYVDVLKLRLGISSHETFW